MPIPDTIIRRKSIRKYKPEPLDDTVIEKIVEYISSLEEPFSGIDWNFDTLPYVDMVRIAELEPGVKAPHYLVLRAERKNLSLQNAGFIGEMAALYMTGMGLGTCWLGSINVTNDFEETLPYVAAIAFGTPDESLRESASDIDRKPMKKIALGETGRYKDIMESARLSPSAANRQPVSYLVYDGKIHVFRKKIFLKFPPISYLNCIDAGISMAHIHTAAKESGYSVRISRKTPDPRWGRRIYQATVELATE